MNILIAADKFKGTLSAQEVCEAISEGLTAKNKNLAVRSMALADGGEGSAQLIAGDNFTVMEVDTFDALLRPLRSSYLLTEDQTAIIEMSLSVGLKPIADQPHSPLHTSSFGFGQVVRRAVESGCRKLILCLGGSATNDCATGFLAALGCRFYSFDRLVEHPTGSDLGQITSIDTTPLDSLLGDCRFTVLADVDNPLLGSNGAARIYAAQKGADKQAIEQLERGAARFSEVAMETVWRNCRNNAMAGAAGGTGYGAMMFLNAEVVGGAEYVARKRGFNEALQWADVVVTGEGKVDSQTLCGKVAGYVRTEAAKAGKRVITVCGIDTLHLPDTWSLTPTFTLGYATTNTRQALLQLISQTDL